MSLKQLIKSNSFWEGVSYFLLPLKIYNRKPKYDRQKSSWDEDKAALISDWAAVGNDFYGVISDYGRK